MEPETGPIELDELADEFDIQRELGRGESAAVYLAHDRALGRRVAMKVVLGGFGADELIEQTIREARILATLVHPHIVSIHAARRLAGGGIALIMQYVEGRTLRELLRERGTLPVDQGTRILRDIARALLAAHAQGVVHRDVKPENIVIDDETGRTLLSDFGSAIPLTGETRLPMDDALVGTPAYMSPEQIDGRPLDARTDLYSLGLVGWELLSGLHPWGEGGVYEVLLRQRDADLPPIDQVRAGVPVPLANAVEGALEKDLGRRWQSAAEFLGALLAPADTPRREPRPRGTGTPAVVPTWAVPDRPATVLRRDDESEVITEVEEVTELPVHVSSAAPDSAAPVPSEVRAESPRPAPRAASNGGRSRTSRNRLIAVAVAATVLVLAMLAGSGALTIGSNERPLAASPAEPANGALERPGELEEPVAPQPSGVELTEERQLQADLAEAAAALSSPRPASTDTAAPVSSPQLVTRSDSLVRCASAARADQQACLLGWLAEYDAPLNRTYQSLIAALRQRDGGREPESVQELRASQRAWLVERDRDCQRRATTPRDGLWATARASCLGEHAERREEELRERLQALSDG